jgi:hypothetical protein
VVLKVAGSNPVFHPVKGIRKEAIIFLSDNCLFFLTGRYRFPVLFSGVFNKAATGDIRLIICKFTLSAGRHQADGP